MAEHKILSLLGMARRAGRLSLGHDAAEEAIAMGMAKMADAKALPGNFFAVRREVIIPMDRPPNVTKNTNRTVTHMLFQNALDWLPVRKSI